MVLVQPIKQSMRHNFFIIIVNLQYHVEPVPQVADILYIVLVNIYQ